MDTRGSKMKKQKKKKSKRQIPYSSLPFNVAQKAFAKAVVKMTYDELASVAGSFQWAFEATTPNIKNMAQKRDYMAALHKYATEGAQ